MPAVIIPVLDHTHLPSEAGATGPITTAVPKDSVTLRTQSRPTHRVRPTIIIKPPPIHHSHFIQHSAVCGHTTIILTYDIAHEGPCSNHLPTMAKEQKYPMKR